MVPMLPTPGVESSPTNILVPVSIVPSVPVVVIVHVVAAVVAIRFCCRVFPFAVAVVSFAAAAAAVAVPATFAVVVDVAAAAIVVVDAFVIAVILLAFLHAFIVCFCSLCSSVCGQRKQMKSSGIEQSPERPRCHDNGVFHVVVWEGWEGARGEGEGMVFGGVGGRGRKGRGQR